MKILVSRAYATSVLLACCVAAGCSSNAQPASVPIAGAQSTTSFGQAHRLGSAGRVSPDNYIQRLYVTDETAKIAVLDNSYNWIDDITGNTPCPSGAWMTRTPPKRLYVANFGCNGIPEVTEFKNLNSPPYGTFDFSYSATLIDPLFVTTDSAQHVYVADYLGDQVVEFANHQNVVLNHCSTSGVAAGIAVDSAGDVFVAGGSMQITEYPGPAGLSGCMHVPLVTVGGSAGGLILDNNDNLIACNQNAVYKIAKPAYNTAVQIPTTASFQCLHLSLNAAGNHLFVSEPFKSTPDIQIIKYPGGLVLPPVLPSPQLPHPVGVAAFPG